MGNMHSMVSGWDTAGAILLLGWMVLMWTAVGVLTFANHRQGRPWVFQGAAGVIGLGLVGQVGHLQEHAAQVGYWVAHPNSKAWMTPWGNSLARGFGQVDSSKPSLGMEILHLAGNMIFLAGLAGVMAITWRARQTRARRWARMGTWMQTIHGLEHLALTLSIALGANRAIGLSTWFGVLPNGPGLWTYRLWWHAVANVVGSVIFGIAVYHLWKEREVVQAAYQSNTIDADATTPEPARVPLARPVADPAGAV